MAALTITRRRAIAAGSAAIAIVVLLVGLEVGWSALVSLNARNQAETAVRQSDTAVRQSEKTEHLALAQAVAAQHSHNSLSIVQACAHWERIYAATTPARGGSPALHSAVEWTVRQLKCLQ